MCLVLFADWIGPRKTASIGQDISDRQLGFDHRLLCLFFISFVLGPNSDRGPWRSMQLCVLLTVVVLIVVGIWMGLSFGCFISSSLFRSRLISFADPRLFSIVFLQLHRPQR